MQIQLHSLRLEKSSTLKQIPTLAKSVVAIAMCLMFSTDIDTCHQIYTSYQNFEKQRNLQIDVKNEDNSNLQFNIQMKQQLIREPNSTTLLSQTQLNNLRKGVNILQEKVFVIYGQLAKESEMELEISILQNQSQEHYDKLRRLARQYAELCDAYRFKIENTSEDIQDERDRAENNVHFLEQEKKRLEDECKQKKLIREKIERQIKIFEEKKDKLSVILAQQNLELQNRIRNNRLAEENMKATREQIEKMQIEIFNADNKAQCLKKYGYETIPQKLQIKIKQRDNLLKELDYNRYVMQQRKVELQKFVTIELFQQTEANLIKQRQLYKQLKQINEINLQLKGEVERLKRIKDQKDLFDKPNLQLQKLQQDLDKQGKKITNIQKDINYLKKKGSELTQKLRAFSEFVDKQKRQSNIDDLAISINFKQKGKKDKLKSAKRPLYQQIQHDLSQHKANAHSSLNWKSLLLKRYQQSKQIIKQSYQKLLEPPQKNYLILFIVIVIFCASFYSRSFKK